MWQIKSARGVVAAAVVLVAALAPSACATRTCAGAASYPPSVWLEATAWFHAHPGGTLKACLGTACSRLHATAGGTAQLEVPHGDKGDSEHLAVTETPRHGPERTERATVMLGEFDIHGGCGTIHEVGRIVDVGAKGGLTPAGVLPGA